MSAHARQLLGSLLVAVAIVALTIVVVTAKLGPQTADERDDGRGGGVEQRDDSGKGRGGGDR
jgi:hypothetical protein